MLKEAVARLQYLFSIQAVTPIIIIIITTITCRKVQFSVQKQVVKLESRYILSEWLWNCCRAIGQLSL